MASHAADLMSNAFKDPSFFPSLDPYKSRLAYLELAYISVSLSKVPSPYFPQSTEKEKKRRNCVLKNKCTLEKYKWYKSWREICQASICILFRASLPCIFTHRILDPGQIYAKRALLYRDHLNMRKVQRAKF